MSKKQVIPGHLWQARLAFVHLARYMVYMTASDENLNKFLNYAIRNVDRVPNEIKIDPVNDMSMEEELVLALLALLRLGRVHNDWLEARKLKRIDWLEKVTELDRKNYVE